MPLLLFLLFPILEIWVLIEVADEIGGWSTLGLLLLAMAAGGMLIRLQGGLMLSRVRDALATGEMPGSDIRARELFDGLCILLGALLLIVPGFISDVLALLLFIPALRGGAGRRLWDWLRGSERVRVYVSQPPRRRRPEPPRPETKVIEGEYHEIPPSEDNERRP